MNGVFALLCILSSVLLIVSVVIQNSKGGGLSSAFGASNISNMIGARRGNDLIEKATWTLIGCLMGFAFLANLFGGGDAVVQKEFRLKNEDLESSIAAPSLPSAPAQQQAPPAEGNQ